MSKVAEYYTCKRCGKLHDPVETCKQARERIKFERYKEAKRVRRRR